jgi:hypothetical protein
VMRAPGARPVPSGLGSRLSPVHLATRHGDAATWLKRRPRPSWSDKFKGAPALPVSLPNPRHVQAIHRQNVRIAKTTPHRTGSSDVYHRRLVAIPVACFDGPKVQQRQPAAGPKRGVFTCLIIR